ncbi:Hsp20/alpha crystallin family protein [Ramlibacter ginsenosidimutans]|nr:Hsp20/alpha crystallin family protein [Ramlibacter ginsenosidimutans]
MAHRTDSSGWMWSQACDLIEQAERMHRQFFRAVATQPAEVVWEPPADVFEDEREVVVVLAMPGVRPERMEVRSEGGTLLVRGVRPLPLAGSGLRVRHLEIPYGRFERRIALPSRGLQLQEPEVADGCVILRLRKNDGGAR